MKIIIIVVIVFVVWCIWDNISMSMSSSESDRKRKAEYEKKAAEARKQYPKIENWSRHPLFAKASSFLVNIIDSYIETAKRTPVGVTGGITLEVRVKTSEIYIGGNYFYYSDQGYDQIRVGYTAEETGEACKEFAATLSRFLADYYSFRENIDIEDNIYNGSINSTICFCFSIDLRGVQPKLKQV